MGIAASPPCRPRRSGASPVTSSYEPAISCLSVGPRCRNLVGDEDDSQEGRTS